MNKSKLFNSVAVVLLPIISYLCLGPLEIYYGNTKDFPFELSDFFLASLGISAVVLLLGVAFLLSLPQKVNNYFCAGILAFGVCSYVQNMFMNTKLVEIDGSQMKWETLGNYPIINLIIWIVIILVIILLCIKLRFSIGLIAGTGAFLSIIQVVAIISLLVGGTGKTNQSVNYNMLGDDTFHVGNKKNVVVYVIDSLGTTLVDDALKEYPNMLDDFQDFTYYTNADCEYYCTFPSMTHLLTGTDFDFHAESSEAWLANAWNSERAKDFYNILHGSDVTCNLFSLDNGYVYGDKVNLVGKFDNIQKAEVEIDLPMLMKKIYKLSAYRYVPYVMKPSFEILTKDFNNIATIKNSNFDVTDDNVEFYEAMKANHYSIKDDYDSVFMVTHLFGSHAPCTTSAQGTYVEEATVYETICGIFKILSDAISEFKELGIYDNTDIIIMADHGSWGNGDTQPLFMVKRSGDHRDTMVFNNAPIAFSDFQATVLELFGLNHEKFGKSIFDWHEGDIRERTVYMRKTDGKKPSVSGSAWNSYYGYTYSGDKSDLNKLVANDEYEWQPATKWIDAK
ncbi:MAG: hypothetical protein IJD55_02710 [Clostridia bacterium]|nr:hypothetical protein [Clostridia bacterium]